MISARSAMRDRPADDLGRRLGRRGDRGQPVERPDEPARVERRRVRRPGAGQGRGVGDRRLAPEQARSGASASSARRRPGVAIGPIEDEPGAQLGLGIGALVGERGRVGRVGPARQHRPALDQDELAGDRDERR